MDKDQCDSLITWLITVLLDWYSGDINGRKNNFYDNKTEKLLWSGLDVADNFIHGKIKEVGSNFKLAWYLSKQIIWSSSDLFGTKWSSCNLQTNYIATEKILLW